MGALDGLLVLSLEQAVAAPYFSCKLADAGPACAESHGREDQGDDHHPDRLDESRADRLESRTKNG